MKKVLVILLAVMLVASLFTGCNASSSPQEYDGSAPTYSSSESSAGNDYEPSEGGDALTEGGSTVSFTEKIIYSYSATVETKAFDETIDNVDVLLEQYGAFVENSYISGRSYGNTTYRTATYTLRVPVANFAGLTGSLDLLGNVFNENTSAQNITMQFLDTQSRLDTYRTEEDRLLAILEKADTVEDMISIEARLSDVRYQIESLTTTLNNWQNQVDFSTVTLRIEEVQVLSEQQSVQRTYWEKINDGLQATIKGIGEFFKSLFMRLVIALPVILLLGVIAVIVIIIVRRVRKNRKNNTGPRPPMPPAPPNSPPPPPAPPQQ